MKPNNGGTTEERTTNNNPETQAMEAPQAAARSDVERVEQKAEEMRGQVEALNEQIEELRSENTELRERVETLQAENEELREEVENLRAEKADVSHVRALEGDFSCPSCERQVHAPELNEVYQAESEGGLLGSEYNGPVTDVRCPYCSEKVDVTDNLDERERVRLTNELREVGVASGEIVDLDEAVEDDESDE